MDKQVEIRRIMDRIEIVITSARLREINGYCREETALLIDFELEMLHERLVKLIGT